MWCYISGDLQLKGPCNNGVYTDFVAIFENVKGRGGRQCIAFLDFSPCSMKTTRGHLFHITSVGMPNFIGLWELHKSWKHPYCCTDPFNCSPLGVKGFRCESSKFWSEKEQGLYQSLSNFHSFDAHIALIHSRYYPPDLQAHYIPNQVSQALSGMRLCYRESREHKWEMEKKTTGVIWQASCTKYWLIH